MRKILCAFLALGAVRVPGYGLFLFGRRGSRRVEGGEGMTPAEKATLLEQFASYRTGCDELFEAVLREAAAHFRTLIPDANGLLPCPMCGAGTPSKVLEQKYKGMLWRRIQCRECALYTPMRRTEIEARRAWNRRGGVAYE